MAMHNGRPFVDRFALERDGFHFVHHDTKVQSFSKRTKSAASTIRRWKRW